MIIPDPNSIVALMKECSERILLPSFGKLGKNQIWQKENNSLVTQADLDSEKFLIRRLMDMVPGSLTVGEEETEGNPRILDYLENEHAVWVVDPLDGTSNYARGDKKFAILISLCVKGEIVAGWLGMPAFDLYLWGIKGEGTWSQGQKLKTKDPGGADLLLLSGSLGDRVRKLSGLENQFRSITNYRCCGAEYVDIALGKLDFAHYRRTKPWDHCAGNIVIREAGGAIGELIGGSNYKPWQSAKEGILVASSDKVFSKVGNVLRKALIA